jgi:CRISPR-associated protein Csh2
MSTELPHTHEVESPENRSEIVFVYDAVDANPNGNPLSGANRPRIDPQTEQCIVTDVRLKRYLRDQLDEDGHGVYIRSVKDDEGMQADRKTLLSERLSDLNFDDFSDEELKDVVYGALLDNSADIRYFGATMSVDYGDERLENAIPDHFTGPVQFSPGKSFHPVLENEEYDSLTSVIATKEGKEQGGFGLDDHRIQYALIGFHGIVNEHAAEATRLRTSDIERLDTLCWRALKNQTLSRSKVGQEPRLYLRVEYDEDSFHIGGLTHDLALHESSKPVEQMRNIRDVTLDISDLVSRLADNADQIQTIHACASDVLEVANGDERGGPELLYAALESAVGDDSVRRIDVVGEFEETLPE